MTSISHNVENLVFSETDSRKLKLTTVNHLFLDNKVAPHLTEKIHKRNTFPQSSYEYFLYYDYQEDDLTIVHHSHIQEDGSIIYDNWGYHNIGLYSLKAILDLNVYIPSFYKSHYFKNDQDIALYIHRVFV